jgi:hypothetical protein
LEAAGSSPVDLALKACVLERDLRLFLRLSREAGGRSQ